jgi:outer membrane receptor for ferric coprogen and ferric-rhodotorulic acid
MQAYLATSGTASDGFELELSGALTERWNISGGLAYYSLVGPNGIAINTYVPRTTIHLFTTYTPDILSDKVTIGGGLRWQNDTHADVTSPFGTQRVSQSPYAVIDVFAKYKISDNLFAQINVSNLFDEEYYAQIGFGNYVGFGPGRSVFGSINYRY